MLNQEEVKKFRAEVIKRFKQFAETPIPEITKAYKMPKGNLLLQFFFVNEYEVMNKQSILIGDGDKKSSDISIKVFPIAKVLSAGRPSSNDEEDQLKPGDFVKVNDSDVAHLNNDYFTEWLDNEYKNSNAVKKTKEPDPTVNNFFRSYKSKFFNLDPFSPNLNDKELVTVFKVMDVGLTKVENLEIIYDHYEKVKDAIH